MQPLQTQTRGVAAAVKGKGKGVDTCYSATYMSQTRDQKRFIISEVVADWHELMIPWCIRPAVQHTDIPPPQSATQGFHPVARKLLIPHPAKGRRLS